MCLVAAARDLFEMVFGSGDGAGCRYGWLLDEQELGGSFVAGETVPGSAPGQGAVQKLLCSRRLDHHVFDDINGGHLLIWRHAVGGSVHIVIAAVGALPVRLAHAAALVVHICVH